MRLNYKLKPEYDIITIDSLKHFGKKMKKEVLLKGHQGTKTLRITKENLFYKKFLVSSCLRGKKSRRNYNG